MPTFAVKKCWSCQLEKPLDSFNIERKQKDGHARTCKVCRSENRKKLREQDPKRFNAYATKYRKANPEKYAEWQYKTRHGITKTEMFALLKEQRNVCKLCGSSEYNGRFWVIDHDHSCCGDINSCHKCRRGVICEHCNKLLGFAKDSKEVLAKAIEYLEEYERSK